MRPKKSPYVTSIRATYGTGALGGALRPQDTPGRPICQEVCEAHMRRYEWLAQNRALAKSERCFHAAYFNALYDLAYDLRMLSMTGRGEYRIDAPLEGET